MISQKSCTRFSPGTSSYIYKISPTNDSSQISASSSSNAIKIFSRENLRPIASFENLHPQAQISGYVCSPTGDFIASCGTDGSFSLMSAGTGSKPFSVVSTGDILSCVDLHSNGYTLALGTQSEKFGQDIRLHIWDCRNLSERVGVLEESFNEDLTKVQFHPTNGALVTTASTDGLVCEFDLLHLANENDALATVYNTRNSLAFFGYYHGGEALYATSHIETFSLWNCAEERCVADFRDLIATETSPGIGCSYLIDAHYSSSEQCLKLYGGTTDGSLMEYAVTPDHKLLRTRSAKLHGDVIRCLYVDDEQGLMFTGGEDSRIIVSSTLSLTSEELSKSASKKQRYKPY